MPEEPDPQRIREICKLLAAYFPVFDAEEWQRRIEQALADANA